MDAPIKKISIRRAKKLGYVKSSRKKCRDYSKGCCHRNKCKYVHGDKIRIGNMKLEDIELGIEGLQLKKELITLQQKVKQLKTANRILKEQNEILKRRYDLYVAIRQGTALNLH